jgi:AcrR family transcriptional regulator
MVTNEVPAVSTRRDRMRALMRQEILDAARRIVREQGIDQLTMRALGQAVGVTATTLYDYFENKDGVLDALFGEGVERLHRSFEEAIKANGPGLPRLRGIGVAYRAFARADPDLFELIFGRVDPTYRPSEPVKSRSAALFETLTMVVREAMAEGQLRAAPPEAVGLEIWAAVHGFVMLEINGFIAECVPMDADEAFADHLRVLYEGMHA